jgi:hypothetical protein
LEKQHFSRVIQANGWIPKTVRRKIPTNVSRVKGMQDQESRHQSVQRPPIRTREALYCINTSDWNTTWWLKDTRALYWMLRSTINTEHDNRKYEKSYVACQDRNIKFSREQDLDRNAKAVDGL